MQQKPQAVRQAERENFSNNGIRFVVFLISGLLGALFYCIPAYSIWFDRYKPQYPTAVEISNLWGMYLAGLLGAGLLAFACAQLMHLFWLSEDENEDDRIWSYLTPPARGLFKLRASACTIWPIRIWCILSLLAVVVTTVGSWRLIIDNFVSIGFQLSAFLALSLFLLWRGIKWTRSAPSPETRGLEKSRAWVSHNRWTLDALGRSWGGWLGLWIAIAMVLVPLVNALPGLHDPDEDIRVTMVLLALFFILSIKDGIAIWRRRKFGRVVIDLTRESFRPLVFDGKILFDTPIRAADRSIDWRLQFISSGVNDYPYRYKILFKTETPVSVDAAGKEASFRLQVHIPEAVPTRYTAWELLVYHPHRNTPVLRFILPPDAIFGEEFPAE